MSRGDRSHTTSSAKGGPNACLQVSFFTNFRNSNTNNNWTIFVDYVINIWEVV